MIQVIKRLSYFIKREKKSYIIMAISLIVISILALLPALIMGDFIDLIGSKMLTKQSSYFLIGSLVLVAIGRYICSWVFHIVSNRKGQQLSFELREEYLMKLFDMDITFFETYSKGELMSRMTQDLEMMKNAVTKILTEIFINCLHIFVITMAMIFTVDLKLTLVSVAIVPFFIIYLNRRLFKARKYYEIHRTIYSEMTESVLESVEGAEVVKAYVQEENDTKKMQEAIQADIDSWKYIVKFEAIFGPMFDFVVVIATFLAFAYGTYQVVHSEISIGQLVTFSMFLTRFTQPIMSLANVFNQFNQVIVAEERIREIFDYEPDVKNEEARELMSFSKIEFENVSFRYPFDDKDVLKNLSFTIEKGKNIGIVGPSGAGKSTIIRHLLREFNVHSGEVIIDGYPISEYKIEDIHELVGYVPQAHVLFKGDVEENILVGYDDASMDHIEKAVKIADFAKDIEFMHKGMRTKVGEFGSGLSGGQKQRLSIARALVGNPEILILDDSLSAVDAGTEQTIIERLEALRGDKTNIIIAHRFSAIKDADTILVVENGQISERGTHDELMKNRGWYFEQYNYQMLEGDED